MLNLLFCTYPILFPSCLTIELFKGSFLSARKQGCLHFFLFIRNLTLFSYFVSTIFVKYSNLDLLIDTHSRYIQRYVYIYSLYACIDVARVLKIK